MPASEVMAVFCLAKSMTELKERFNRMVVGQSRAGTMIRAEGFAVSGAMAVLLKDAFLPYRVQTVENTPALIHGGPFGNIAYGCNSIRATRAALKMADYVVTEAGPVEFRFHSCQSGGTRSVFSN